ncbi:MAG: DUF4446 family protein [bacterium]|nr:DUF4446 family protein [bacterium]
MTLDTNTLLYILVAGIIVAIALGLHTEWRMSRLLRGKNTKSLEDVIIKNSADIQRFKDFRKEIEIYLAAVENRLKGSTRGVGTVRFNPFKGIGEGGNQSFATAFLDERGNGVVLSTLNSRGSLSIFAKPIEKFASTYELTGEEKEAIKQAQERLNM